MVSCSDKGGNPSTCKDIKTCYYYGKLNHIIHFCFKAKNNDKEKIDAKIAKDDDDDYTFIILSGVYFKAICK